MPWYLGTVDSYGPIWDDVSTCHGVMSLPGTGAGMQWGFEEGVLDLGLLVVLFYERCRDDISEGQS